MKLGSGEISVRDLCAVDIDAGSLQNILLFSQASSDATVLLATDLQTSWSATGECALAFNAACGEPDIFPMKNS